MNKGGLIIGLNMIVCAACLMYYGNKAKDNLPASMPHRKFVYLCIIALICGAFVALGSLFNLGFSRP